jgi:hypothetical protein
MTLMTQPVRKQLSALAWGLTGFCSLLLLVAAMSAAAHKHAAARESTAVTATAE